MGIIITKWTLIVNNSKHWLLHMHTWCRAAEEPLSLACSRYSLCFHYVYIQLQFRLVSSSCSDCASSQCSSAHSSVESMANLRCYWYKWWLICWEIWAAIAQQTAADITVNEPSRSFTVPNCQLLVERAYLPTSAFTIKNLRHWHWHCCKRSWKHGK